MNKTLAKRFHGGLSDDTMQVPNFRRYGNNWTLLQNIWSFVVAILFLGALGGSFSIRFIADWIGRKKGLYISIAAGVLGGGMAIASKFVSSLVFLTDQLIQFQIPLFELYIASRIVMGWSVAVSLGLSALFLSEARLVAYQLNIWTCFIVLNRIEELLEWWQEHAFSWELSADQLWPCHRSSEQKISGKNFHINWTPIKLCRWCIYATEIGIMLLFGAALPFFPESPGFLIQRGATEAATKSLQFYYVCDHTEAQKHLNEIKDEQKSSTRYLTTEIQETRSISRKFKMMDVVRKKSLRDKAFIGVVVTFAMSFSGVAVINAFAFEILKDTGLTVLEASLANDAISVVSMVNAFFWKWLH